MAIFSTTASGLQNGLNNLSQYCKKWGLTVNVIKTKIVVFRKGGRAAKDEVWTFNERIIEVVSCFKYVGCVFSNSGSFKHCVNSLVGSARKALFSLKRIINQKSELIPKIQIDLFNTMVAQILHYGCEVWGLRRADPIEKFHLAFLKSVLGVKSSTTNCYVYGELGVFPLLIKRQVRVVKYWLKIIRSLNVKENYVQFVYRELLRVNSEYPDKITWVSETRKLLETSGFGFVWQQQFVENENGFISTFEKRLCDIYRQNWLSQVNLTSEGRLYKHIKMNFKLESYLFMNNKAFRMAITKIRLSSHLFMIERGRWGSNSLARNERLCQICNCIEDEFHVLVECPIFNNERTGLLNKSLQQYPNVFNFYDYLNSENIEEQKKLGLLCLKIQIEYRKML